MDYKNGKIYQILNHKTNDVYVGSTCQPLSKRMAKHRHNLNQTKPYNYNIYQTMRKLGVENFYIELIENYPCDTVDELKAREGHYIRERGTLNTHIEGRTKQEWYKDNIERVKQQKKARYEDMKPYLLQQAKEYKEKHKEQFVEYRKNWLQRNKARLYEKYICECGKEGTVQHKARHEKSLYHQNYLQCIYIE